MEAVLTLSGNGDVKCKLYVACAAMVKGKPRSSLLRKKDEFLSNVLDAKSFIGHFWECRVH